MSKAQAITRDIAHDSHTQRTIFRVLASSLIALSLVYVYLIGSMTFNILARKTLETKVRSLGTEISSLELTYLAAANKIDKNYASSIGFVDASDHDSIFLTRDSARVAIR